MARHDQCKAGTRMWPVLLGCFLVCYTGWLVGWGVVMAADGVTDDMDSNSTGSDSIRAGDTGLHDMAALDFSFLKNPPGEMILLGGHRMHVDCRGSGNVTVLFEAGLGGNALEWQPVQKRIAGRARACIYDRAGYGWSDPSPFPRFARRLAVEADSMLDALNVQGPLVLVGHSFGGFIVRSLAQLRADDMVGMVLVDASHEEQLDRFETLGGIAAMPTGRRFTLSSIGVPENLPATTHRQIFAFSRLRKTYDAIHAEMTFFRASAAQMKADRDQVDYPVHVLRRGKDVFSRGDNDSALKNATWQALQEDLAGISTQGSITVAEQSGHHIHVDQPGLVADTIEALLDEHEKN